MDELVQILDRIQNAHTDGTPVISAKLITFREQILTTSPAPGSSLWQEFDQVVEAREAEIGHDYMDVPSLRLWTYILKALAWRAQGQLDWYAEELNEIVRFAQQTSDTESLSGFFNQYLPMIEAALAQARS
jgi:hypothetical protein